MQGPSDLGSYSAYSVSYDEGLSNAKRELGALLGAVQVGVAFEHGVRDSAWRIRPLPIYIECTSTVPGRAVLVQPIQGAPVF